MFSFIILFFCFFQIVFGKGENTTEWTLISGIMGYWLPSPTNKAEK